MFATTSFSSNPSVLRRFECDVVRARPKPTRRARRARSVLIADTHRNAVCRNRRTASAAFCNVDRFVRAYFAHKRARRKRVRVSYAKTVGATAAADHRRRSGVLSSRPTAFKYYYGRKSAISSKRHSPPSTRRKTKRP